MANLHESVVHSTELDRALLWEADYAGTSFLTPDKTGKLEFGSKICNFYGDRTQPHGLATVAYDDEGVPAQRWPLVKDGIFVDWQTTRDLAPLIGNKKSYGCLHADSWGSVPFPRMPNVSLEPAKENVSLEDLMGGRTDALKLVSSLTLFHAAAEQLGREDPVYASLAERLAALLGQTGEQGYPACDFTLAQIADESSKE